MHSILGVFSVFLFATILLIPTSSFSFANAQDYDNDKYLDKDYNKKDNYYFENNKPDYIDKDGKQYYYHYPSEDKEFQELVQECEECFFSELVKLDRKTADIILYQIDKRFGSLTELCKLIAADKIDRDKLERIINKILNSPELIDLKQVKKFFKDYETRSSVNYNLDEIKFKDKRVDAKSIDEFKENILECTFPTPIIYVVWTDDTPGENDILFAVSTDNGQTFSEPDNISDNEGESDGPQIAVQGDTVYLVWEDNTPGNRDILFAISTDNGQTFSEPDNISDNDGTSGDPQIAVQGDNVYIVWRDSTPGNFDTLFAISTDNGQTFSEPDNISDNDGDTSGDPQVAVQGDNVYIVWSDDTPGNNDILFAISTDNGQTFSEPDNISDNDGSSFQPQIAVQGDNVYIVWSDDTPSNRDILFAVSTDNGQTFSEPDNISDNDGSSFQPQIAVQGDNVYIVWSDGTPGENDIFFAVSTDNGQTFTTPDNISDNTGSSDGLQIAVQGDNVYIVWSDGTPGENDILFAVSTDNGQTFSEPDNISDNDGSSFQPQIAVQGDNVYIVWSDDTPGENDILFAVSTDNGQTFSEPDNISDNDGSSFQPQIAAK